MRTICKNCKHREFNGQRWYDKRCLHEKAREIRTDWSTGETIVEQKHCRDVNTDGQCQLYEARSNSLLGVFR